jgi:DNA-binding MarR family transcriptional regulator
MSTDILSDMAEQCVLTRTRVISRVLSNIYDDEYRPLGINSTQLTLLLVIHKLDQPSRAEISRFNHQEKSTLTRNLKILLDAGWIEEVLSDEGGRARPIALTAVGESLMRSAAEPFKRAQAKALKVLGERAVSATMEVASGMMKFPGSG